MLLSNARSCWRSGWYVAGRIAAVLGCLTFQYSNVASGQDLADLSLEQLSSIKVASVSKRLEPLADAPASIYVISREDIRRSGATTLPEVLRMAPNLQVARVDANSYAITARGFNSTTANKLLVQIDGRSIYTPLYSGVFWDVQDVVLEDIDRIEVVSGPGATTWGSNAVNGFINIITRRASATQEGIATVMTGNDGQRQLQARYGGSFANDAAWRVYVKRDQHGASSRGDYSMASDAMKKTQAGFRVDSGNVDKGLTFLGDAYQGTIDQTGPNRPIHVSGANLVARWYQPTDDGGRQRLQFYYDGTRRDWPGAFSEHLDIFDVDALRSFQLNKAHLVTVSAGYRFADDSIVNTPSFAFLPADENLYWANMFINDDIQVTSSTRVSIGTRLEYNVYSHWEWLPGLRVSHKLDEDSMIWGALSRSVRTPSRIDRDLYSPATPPYILAGGPGFTSEISNTAELGYRDQVSAAFSYSLTSFYHRFSKLRGASMQGTALVLDNSIDGHTYGVEGWASYRITPAWRIDGGFLQQRQKYVSRGIANISSLGNDPHYQYQLRATADLSDALNASVSVRRVGRLPVPEVPGYTAVDLHTGYRLNPRLELFCDVDNLFDHRHREFSTAGTGSEFGRMLHAGVSLEF